MAVQVHELTKLIIRTINTQLFLNKKRETLPQLNKEQIRNNSDRSNKKTIQQISQIPLKSNNENSF